MADTAVDTTTATEITEKELKEKKEVVVEELKEAEKENGSGDAPAKGNGTDTNGADHSDKAAENGEEKKKNGAAEEGAEEEKKKEEEEVNGVSAGAAEEGAEEEKKKVVEAEPVKRPAEEEKVETKKQKMESENGDSKEAEVEA